MVKNSAYSNEGQKNLVSIINNTGSESSKGEDDHTFCDQIISLIIRKCWQ